jgi:5-methylcytosine-specific restriction enzyme A
MQTTFKGKVVTQQDILEALQEFSTQYPDPDTYDNWLQKGNYVYILRYGETIYPPKHILSRATGIPTSDFSGGDQTKGVFQQLGFIVEKKS